MSTQKDARGERAGIVDPLVGQVIADRFVLERCIGEGGVGRVYLATHDKLARRCAVKLLSPGGSADRTSRLRFQREARVAASLDHPGIVAIYDFGHSARQEPYLVMEYVEGRTLAEVLRAERSLAPAVAVSVALGVAEALLHAHEHDVIHRDVKPANIMLTQPEGRPSYPKILDFGLARFLSEAPLTQAGRISGTLEYLAPEIWERAEVAPPGDVYALGVMLYEMLAGGCPFTAEEPIAFAHKHVSEAPPPLSVRRGDLLLPGSLKTLVDAMLLKDPKERPPLQRVVAALKLVAGRLPPAELTALQALKTQLLPDGDRGRLVRVAPTLHQPAAAAGEEGPPTLIMAGPPEFEDAPRAADIERLSNELFGCAVSLARRLWHPIWDGAARDLYERLGQGEQHHAALEEALSRVAGLAAREQLRADEERRAAHRRLLDLRLRLEDPALPPPERAHLLLEQAAADREYFLSAPDPAVARQAELLRARLLELRRERHRGRCAFARAVLAAWQGRADRPREEVADLTRLLNLLLLGEGA